MIVNPLYIELLKSFDGLKFHEEPHDYYYGDIKLIPVSNIVERFYEKFDTSTKSKEYSVRHNIPVDEVRANWEDIRVTSLKNGSFVHNFAERYVLNKYYNIQFKNDNSNLNSQQLAVVDYWDKMPKHLFPVGIELRMFSENLGVAGTLDTLLYNRKTGKFIISDYKTNKDIYKNFKEKLMLPPFEYLLDMPFNHYQIQLSLYKMLLEEKGYFVESMEIAWLQHSGELSVLKVNDFSEMLKPELS